MARTRAPGQAERRLINILVASYNQANHPNTILSQDVKHWLVKYNNKTLPSGREIQLYNAELELIDGSFYRFELDASTSDLVGELLKNIGEESDVPEKMDHKLYFPAPLDMESISGRAGKYRAGYKEHNIRLSRMANSDDSRESYAYVCACKGSPDYFCNHIVWHLYSKDTNEWSSTVQSHWNRTKKAVDIGIPLFGYILHRISIKYFPIKEWDDTESARYEIDANLWYADHETILVDTDQPKILLTMYKANVDSMIQNSDKRLLSMLDDVRDFACGRANCPCRARTHNYGKNAQLQNWISMQDSSSTDRIRACSFTLLNYGVCYICYIDSEATFSLLDMP